MKEIKLGKSGKVALVDDEDYERVVKYSWCRIINQGGIIYAQARIDGEKKYLHRFIMNVNNPKIFIDHINRNGLDNQKCNLRFATNSQNQQNRVKTQNCTSKYKGVCWISGKWQTYIKVSKKNIYLGRYNCEEEAAQIYNNAARKYFGKFARLNKLGEES